MHFFGGGGGGWGGGGGDKTTSEVKLTSFSVCKLHLVWLLGYKLELTQATELLVPILESLMNDMAA